MYTIDRKAASRLLKVSTRTIDRYIARKRLSFEKRDGRIWLDKKEVLRARQRIPVDRDIDMMSSEMSSDKIHIIPVDAPESSVHSGSSDFQTVYSRNFKDESPRRDTEEEVYKKLFEQLQEELKTKQERLEAANYRVGQLESHLKESIPLLDYNREIAKEREEKESIRKNLDAQQFEVEQLLNNLKEERFNKKVYLIILFILLLLQPLWFFFPFR